MRVKLRTVHLSPLQGEGRGGIGPPALRLPWADISSPLTRLWEKPRVGVVCVSMG